jgi:hypothetical protein
MKIACNYVYLRMLDNAFRDAMSRDKSDSSDPRLVQLLYSKIGRYLINCQIENNIAPTRQPARVTCRLLVFSATDFRTMLKGKVHDVVIFVRVKSQKNC